MNQSSGLSSAGEWPIRILVTEATSSPCFQTSPHTSYCFFPAVGWLPGRSEKKPVPDSYSIPRRSGTDEASMMSGTPSLTSNDSPPLPATSSASFKMVLLLHT